MIRSPALALEFDVFTCHNTTACMDSCYQCQYSHRNTASQGSKITLRNLFRTSLHEAAPRLSRHNVKSSIFYAECLKCGQSALPYRCASTLLWKDSLQEGEFGTLEYQILSFSVETANKSPFGTSYKACCQRYSSIRSHPENPISQCQPSESELATWEHKSQHCPSPATTSALAFRHRCA